MAAGAKCRVFRWEALEQGGLRLRTRHRALQSARASTEHFHRTARWAAWLDDNMIATVLRAIRPLEDAARAAGVTLDNWLQGERDEPLPRQLWQRTCGAYLAPPGVAGLAVHLRRRLDRWPLQALPGYRVARLRASLAALRGQAHPCGWAASLKAMLGG